ncbi:MAG: methylmalonyl-CoA epimerase [Deltaproteobacteria bacterium]|nr:methylmalonyl-CoA epimerase [Deltaproteobacteria bacterium]
MSHPRVAHVGIAVTDLDAATEAYRALLGHPEHDRETVEEQGVEVVHFEAGDAMLELLQPTRPDSPVGRFLQKRGEGIHHVAVWVDDLRAELARLGALGVTLIDKVPRVGAGGHLVAFVHPRSTRGVLVELTEKRKDPAP